MNKAILEGIPVYASYIWRINKTIDKNYEEKITVASREGKLRCPECGAEVIFKNAHDRKEQFSHKNKSYISRLRCTYSKQKEKHIEGKHLLIRHIQKNNPDVYSEMRYKLGNGQLADLYFKFKDGQELVIEFHSNSDKIKEWEVKDKYYKANNINALWFDGDEMDLSNENRASDLLREHEFIFDKGLLLNDEKNRTYTMDYLTETLMIVGKVVKKDVGKSYIVTAIAKTYTLDDIKILPNGEIECDFKNNFDKENEKIIKSCGNASSLNANNIESVNYAPTNKDKEFFEFIKHTCNKELTEEQKNAILYNDIYHVIQSTAGSGKTTVICIKIAYLILVKGLSPRKIAVVSFTKNSAKDIEERFISLFGKIIKDEISFSTIDSFASGILKDKERKTGIKYTFIEDDKNLQLSKRRILSSLYQKFNKEKINEDQYKELASFIAYVRNKMIYLKDMKDLEDKFPVPNFLCIYEDYSKLLNDKKLLDYDSQLVRAHFILTKDKEILNYYQNLYSYYLVDESQDNSKIQNEILILLSQKGNTCYVGDSDQRIYSWRGADDRFNKFKELYPNSKTLFMGQNFRSTSSIVNLANAFIKLDEERLDKEIHTNNEEGEKVKVISPENEKSQIDTIINSLVEEDRPYSDYAILYRNNISAISVVERLDKENIPFYIKEEVSSFFNSFIVKDILNFIKFANNQCDQKTFKQIYYKTQIYLRKEILGKVLSKSTNGKDNILDLLISSNDVPINNSDLCKVLKINFETLLNVPPSLALDIIQYDLNYYEYLENYSNNFHYSMEMIDNILSILKSIFVSLNNVSELNDKLESLKELMRTSKKNKDENAICLSTMHSSKGLEWERVFIIDTQMIPNKTSLNEKTMGMDEKYREEVRTFFVAITRPKKSLTILQPKYKNNQEVISSDFFNFCSTYLFGTMDLEDIKIEQISLGILGLQEIKFDEIVEGMKLYHKNLGTIYIHKVNQDGNGEVAFEGGEIKKLAFNFCIEKHLLKKLKV